MSRSSAARQTDEELMSDVLPLLPAQGEWTEEDYLWLSARTNHLVELVDGRIEVIPIPTERHQAILSFLFLAFLAVAQRMGGKVFFAPLRMRVGADRFREPDLLFLRAAEDPRRGDRFWTGADLVLEVVSPDDPQRDLVTKRLEYAQAGVLEYWIVDPRSETIEVLGLEGERYARVGRFERGASANSALLPGFQVPVDEVFDAR
jgi:Uma2 family endonuclease